MGVRDSGLGNSGLGLIVRLRRERPEGARNVKTD